MLAFLRSNNGITNLQSLNTASWFKNTHNYYCENAKCKYAGWTAAGGVVFPNVQFSHTSFKCMFLVPQTEFTQVAHLLKLE